MIDRASKFEREDFFVGQGAMPPWCGVMTRYTYSTKEASRICLYGGHDALSA
jgi:hypothetical protein